MELRFGSSLREDFESFWQNIETEIISRVKILPLGYDEVLIAGDILAYLQKSGQITGIEDVLIASTALIHKLVMVTAHTRHFSKIKRLVIENWMVSD
jgi:predicted nucleic acid-binding protein